MEAKNLINRMPRWAQEMVVCFIIYLFSFWCLVAEKVRQLKLKSLKFSKRNLINEWLMISVASVSAFLVLIVVSVWLLRSVGK